MTRLKRNLPQITELIRVWKGNPLAWAGTACVGAGLAILTGLPLLQIGYAVVFALGGKSLDLPDPSTVDPPTVAVGLLLILLGVAVLLIWHFTLPERPRSSDVPGPVQLQSTPHDIELYSAFRQLITDGDLDFFRNWDFGNSFPFSRTDNVDTLVETWRGARYSFNDPDLAGLFRAVMSRADELVEALMVSLHPLEVNGNLAHVPYGPYSEFDPNPAFYEKLKKLRALSRAFVAAVDEFEVVATARLSRG